jgi:hypothetical protein
MTATCSSVIVVQNELFFFMDKALAKNEIYTSMIQSVIEYEIILFLMVNLSTLIAGRRSRALESLEID